MRPPPCAKHRKRQDEQHRESGTVKGASDQVRIVLEDARPVVPQVELDEEAREDLAEDDACLRLVVRDVAGELYELREVDVGDVEAADFGDELLPQQLVPVSVTEGFGKTVCTL